MNKKVFNLFYLPRQRPRRKSEINVRRKQFSFDAVKNKRFWYGGRPFRTALMNSWNILFPIAEDFFIKTLKEVSANIDDALLKSDIRKFQAQEAAHSRAHKQVWDILEQQGHNVDEYKKIVDQFVTLTHSITNENIRLGLTAAFEHFTALFAQMALENGLNEMEPEMRELFIWHAIEEIEHKAVAFDVYIDQIDFYPHRLLCYLLGTSVLVVFTGLLTSRFLYQEGEIFALETWQDLLDFLFIKEGLVSRSLPLFFKYFRSDFHPYEDDLTELLQLYLRGFAPQFDAA